MISSEFAVITVESSIPYNFQYSFWDDLTEAEKNGLEGICEWFQTIKENIKTYNYKELTELVLATNHKIWDSYKKDNVLAEAYEIMWRSLDTYAFNTLVGEELQYFLHEVD